MSSIKAIALAKVVGGGGGGDTAVEALTVNANGTYTAPSGKAYSPVNVNVAPNLTTKVITGTGTFTPPEGVDGFSRVTVTIMDADGVNF